MPRTKRYAPGGIVFHVINRGNQRSRIFWNDADYFAFEAILAEGLDQINMRLLGYC